MSATPYAPDKAQTDSILNFIQLDLDTLYKNEYLATVRNRFTNTAENKQFDNICIPKELYQKAICEDFVLLTCSLLSLQKLRNLL